MKMDYEAYRKAYFVDPPPQPRFQFSGLHGAALYFNEYEKAVAYYTQVLGSPGYVEGKNTNAWQLGNIWITLFPAKSGSPQNAELIIQMETPAEVDRLRDAFVAAGASGDAAMDTLMFEPLRFASVQDPFGTLITIVSPLPQ